MYPERRGQTHTGQVDWQVAALDGLGLLLFFVPGVIAFAVDFYSGAMYLPAVGLPEFPTPEAGSALPSSYSPTPAPLPVPSAGGAVTMRRVLVPRSALNQRRIEAVVATHVGRPVAMARTRVSPLATLDQFVEQCRHHDDNCSYGVAVDAFFVARRTT